MAKTLGEFVDRCASSRDPDLRAFLANHSSISGELKEDLETFAKLSFTVEEQSLPAGRKFGDFEIEKRLGGGSFGVVYKAWQISLERQVALKTLQTELLADPKAVERFRREAQVIAKLDHPNVVRVYSTGVHEGTPYINMELVDGKSLQQLLDTPSAQADPAARGGRSLEERLLDPALALGLEVPRGKSYYAWIADLFAGAAEGLQHAHACGVVHRDLKPSNLILTLQGRLCILDFGLALAEDGRRLSASGERMGTPSFMSPEQSETPSHNLRPSTDIYSLGATLYTVLAGRPPLEGSTSHETIYKIRNEYPHPLRRLNSAIPRDLEVIVAKCLYKKPAERFGTAEALAQELRRFARGDPIETEPPPWFVNCGRRLWRWRRRLMEAGGAAALIASVLVLLSISHERAITDAHRRYDDAMAQPAEVVMMEELRLISRKVSPALGEEIRPKEEESWKGDERLKGGVDRLFDAHGPGILFEPKTTVVAQDSLLLALVRLEEAARILPQDPRAYYYLARAHFLSGQRDKAAASLDKALERDAGFVPALIMRALRLGDEAAARAVGRSRHRWGPALLEAERAQLELKWEKVALAYDRALQEWPQDDPCRWLHVEVQLMSGFAHLMEGESLSALRQLSVCESKWPDRLEPGLFMGKACHQLAYPQEAAQIFEDLVAKFGAADKMRKLEASLEVAAMYQELGDLDEALRWARQAHTVNENHPSARLAIGNILMERGSFKEAERWFECREPAGKDQVRLLIAHGVCLDSQGGKQAQAAQAKLRRAVRLDPQSGEAHYQLARVLGRVGASEEAVREYAEAIRLDDGYAALARNGLGTVHDRGGLLDLAIGEYREAIRLAPWLAVSHYNLGWALQRRFRFAEAAAAYRRALDLGLDLPIVHNNLGPCLQFLQKLPQAIEEYERAIAETPDNAVFYKSLASAFDWLRHQTRGESNRRKALEDGIKACETAVKLAPEWPEARTLLAGMLEGRGDLDAAMAHYRAVAERWPKYAPALQGLARRLASEASPLPDLTKLPAEILAFEEAEPIDDADSPISRALERYREALLPNLASYASVDWLFSRPQVLAPADSNWRSFPGGSAPDRAWTKLAFDDGSWMAPEEMKGAQAILHLRHNFTIDDPSRVETLVLIIRTLEGDGFTAYLNGEEVASEPVGEPRPGRVWKRTSVRVAPGLIRQGGNVLALKALNAAPADGGLPLEASLLASPAPRVEILERAQRGLEAYEAQLQGIPDGSLAAYFRGRVLALSGDPAGALERFIQVIKQGRKRPEPHLRLAECHSALGDPFSAEESLRRALDTGLADHERVWDAWLRTVAVDLCSSPAEILERFPFSSGGVTGRGADIRWVLERLSAGVPVKINCGGTDSGTGPGSWGHDRFFQGSGRFLYLTGLDDRISELRDPGVQLTSRVFWTRAPVVPGYRIPLPQGSYAVTMTFVEAWKDVGQKREFDVLLEGEPCLSRYRPMENGFGIHDEKTFKVEVTDGFLDVEFVRRGDDPELCALAIQRL